MKRDYRNLLMMSKEARMVNLARNALLVAGHEMGTEGDHWPVIKATIHGIMKDWEELQIERNVSEELKEHLGAILKDLEAATEKCPEFLLDDYKKILADMREIYEAQFTPVDASKLPAPEPGGFTAWRSAREIMGTLGEDAE